MCGIAGIVDPDLSADLIRPIVQRMTDTLTHRGPDDEGFFVTDAVGLGMRRLSIIDVAGGQQPISNEDGLVQVVFNGEIYNYPELRNHLSKRGHVFRTNSDTEVIAHVYEERGVDGLTDLRGMFGIAVWDQRARRLLLARDRLGKKPLFYAKRGNRLLFGSEIKALLAADPTLAEADADGVLPYFQYGGLAEPRTMFRHIHKLPAASWLLYAEGEIQIAPYWRLRFPDDDVPKPKWAHVVEELDALLEEAVRIRLMSEVPLGVFLSGGLDSSTIVAYAHKAGLRPLKTFTIGFDRQGWDESADAALVARHFQTDHHVLTLRERDLAHGLPQTLMTLVSHVDEPFGDASALPTYYVSKLAREHVTVILSGDGGDEVFAGYDSYRATQFAEYYRRVPRWLGADCLPALFERAAQCLPGRQRYSALRVAKVLRDSRLPFEDMYWTKGSVCRPALLRQLFTDDVKAQLDSSKAPACSDDITAVMRSSLPVLTKATYASLRMGLLNSILVKVDRMSMAHSLEVRSPLLDHRLVEFVAGLPPSFKVRGWQTKAILRDTIRRYLPPATLRKGKQGFNMPLRDWLRTGLNEMVGDFLESAHGRLPPELFNRAAVRRLLRQHRLGEADYSLPIWLLLNYATWHDSYIARGGPSAAARHASEARAQIVA
jgi:asparagine synthase (glutamine-hydrolysing)